MELLKAKLARKKELEREAELKQHYNDKGEIAFGSQIRSYVLQALHAGQRPPHRIERNQCRTRARWRP